MSAAAPPQLSPVDAVYGSQRLRLASTVAAAVAAAWAHRFQDREAAISQIVRLVAAGQAHTVNLVEAYMAAKAAQDGVALSRVGLDPAAYTTETLRGIAADIVYARPFGAYGAFLNEGQSEEAAIRAAKASVSKLAATDLQLAQTHAARDWMRAATEQDETRALQLVGYRRVLAGAGPHCALCTAAATRTYRAETLLPIHEHCTCTVAPLWGTEPVASVGTTVRVEEDPELGPRLLADSWTSVGPRLIEL